VGIYPTGTVIYPYEFRKGIGEERRGERFEITTLEQVLLVADAVW
jgi:hypothetical protein